MTAIIHICIQLMYQIKDKSLITITKNCYDAHVPQSKENCASFPCRFHDLGHGKKIFGETFKKLVSQIDDEWSYVFM